jgi:glucose-6-phosphate isomerase
MIDLAKISGLPLQFKDNKLSFGKGVVSRPVSTRQVDEVRDYLKNPRAKFNLATVYLVYRGVCLERDQKLFKDNNLRYDITVIFPGFLDEEFPKTAGHHHPLKSGTDTAYPEIYEVLSGTAYFLFQQISVPVQVIAGEPTFAKVMADEDEKNDDAPENYLIIAKAGEKVIVPPGFGHIMINPANEPLIVADIFADNIEPIYEYLKKHRGGAYYILKTEAQKLKTEKNNNYKKIGELKIGEPKEIPKLNIDFKKPLYLIAKENPKTLEFLTSPERFQDILIPTKLFKL